MDLNQTLKKAERLETKVTFYFTEYIWRVLICQNLLLKPIAKTNITPNQITLFGLFLVLVSFVCMYFDYAILGGICFLIYSILDHLDGTLARYKNLSSKLGAKLDDICDHIAFNGVFIVAYFTHNMPLYLVICYIIILNFYRTYTASYIHPHLKKLKQIKRFGLKKFFLDRGWILGIDASLLGILLSIAIFTSYYEIIAYILCGIYIFDLIYRSIELWINEYLDRKNFSNDKAYWDLFYSKTYKNILEPSLFAKYIFETFLKTNKNINLIEFGCGNGRDALYFSSNKIKVTAIDSSEVAIKTLSSQHKNINFICGDFSADLEIYKKEKFNICYSRFTLHAINEEKEDNLIENVKYIIKANSGLFCIEARSINDLKFGKGKKISDNEYIFDGHYRRFINVENLLKKLENKGFDIIYCDESENFAPAQNEKCVCFRLIAKLKE